MNDNKLKQLLNNIKSGEVSVEQAIESLKILPYDDIGFAKIDHHRGLRKGAGEVVFCQGKTPEQTTEIMIRIYESSGKALGTRADAKQAEMLKDRIPTTQYNSLSRCLILGNKETPINPDRYIAVASAGTADLPVAEEAVETAEFLGSRVERVYDVGVAGIHRLFDKSDVLLKARVVVVVAGMEGALASVVGGIVSAPVVAVPTSIGYGASFNGLAPLLAMLNSCAPGISVVNIDNGFGAGYLAHVINNL